VITFTAHIQFSGDERPLPPKTASTRTRKDLGVCRDFAMLAICFCRCLHIPARYCTGLCRLILA